MSGLRKYINDTIDRKRVSPAQDLISLMVEAQSEENKKLTKDELLANSILILIAGHETTVNLIGNGIYNLLIHPDQRELFQNNPDLTSSAVEEILRFDPAVQIVRRIAREKYEIGGVTINPDEAITILIGACNRDPRVFSEPDKFDILRENNRHITFGAGIHYCLGAELARTEARIALRHIFNKFPEMKLADRPIPYKGPFALRGPRELWISAS